MADNRDLAALTGNVATDERTIGGVTVHVQRVGEIGGGLVNAAQVNISTTAATLIAANDTRKRLTIVNRLGVPLFIGEATVTAANGFQIDNGAAFTTCTVALIQGITAIATSGVYVHLFEEYD